MSKIPFQKEILEKENRRINGKIKLNIPRQSLFKTEIKKLQRQIETLY